MEKQFVVQLDNYPGELARLARALGQRGVNITHITCAGAGPIACAMVTTDDEIAEDVLKTLGHDYLEGQTVVVDVLDKPGGFADVAEQLTAGGVNILATMVVGRREGIMEMAYAVDDAEKAREIVAKAALVNIC